MNKLHIELLLQEFREWDDQWIKYDNGKSNKKPLNIEQFVKEMSKYYKVKVKKIIKHE